MVSTQSSMILVFPFLVMYVIFLYSSLTLKTSKDAADFPTTSIALGSSISASSSPNYWLSPSGVFAFGFYPSCVDCNQYTVGIWLEKSPKKTLIWSANQHLQHITNASSLLLAHDHGLILQNPGVTSTPLLGKAPIRLPSYAMMHDTGNFVLYDSDSNIVWQSFDHPTDTIVSGQTLKSGYNLTSSVLPYRVITGHYQLCMLTDGNLVGLDCSIKHGYCNLELDQDWESDTNGKSVELNLDSTGRLYLSDSYGLIIKTLTEGVHPHRSMNGILLYRATLESYGVFQVVKESIYEENEHPHVIWYTERNQDLGLSIYAFIGIMTGFVILLVFIRLVVIYHALGYKSYF